MRPVLGQGRRRPAMLLLDPEKILMASAKETVAFTSILASGLLTALKLTVGLLTGSLGILSEAAHSALDCAGTVLTFIAIRIGDKPPDDDHP